MKIPKTENGLVKTGWRLPVRLYMDLVDAAARNGRAMNAEAIARLEAVNLDNRLSALERDNAEIKTMLRELLDK